MKTDQLSRNFSEMDQPKKRFTFGDLIVNVYDACGKRKANGILRLALKAHLIKVGASQSDLASLIDKVHSGRQARSILPSINEPSSY